MTLIKALVEYRTQGRQKRAEQFFALRKKLKEGPEFIRIAELLDVGALGDTTGASDIDIEAARSANNELKTTPFRSKREYLGLFEEVALCMNSGLISPAVAHYMFGYYVILCWESDAFWKGSVNRMSGYWTPFRDFAETMKAQRDSFVYHKEDFRFLDEQYSRVLSPERLVSRSRPITPLSLDYSPVAFRPSFVGRRRGGSGH